MKMNLEINEEVKSILRSKGISQHEGIPFLLSVYFKYIPSYIPVELKRRIYSTNILTIDYGADSKDPEIIWNIPLFKNQSINKFDWIKEYMDKFGAVNSRRRGTRSYVEKRMRDLFSKNPDIRKEEVLKAVDHYISTLDNPMYIISSHKFISNEQGTPLLDLIMDLRVTDNEEHVLNPFKRII